MAENLIYTIGTSNRSISEFIDILKYYKIKILVDIRRFPTSKFKHFQKENLEKFLKENSIDYIYLGKELGGYRKEGYENYMKTSEFKDGLNRLRDLANPVRNNPDESRDALPSARISNGAKDRIVCICCSERFAFRCHRRFIALALENLKYRVIHIIDKEISERSYF